jgi:hypothetical protein
VAHPELPTYGNEISLINTRPRCTRISPHSASACRACQEPSRTVQCRLRRVFISPSHRRCSAPSATEHSISAPSVVLLPQRRHSHASSFNSGLDTQILGFPNLLSPESRRIRSRPKQLANPHCRHGPPQAATASASSLAVLTPQRMSEIASRQPSNFEPTLCSSTLFPLPSAFYCRSKWANPSIRKKDPLLPERSTV